MSKKQLNEFFVALGVGDHKKAQSILETVVQNKLANRINENSPDFPTREFNGSYVGRFDDHSIGHEATERDEEQPEANRWDLIAQYVAAKQVIATGWSGDDAELERLESQVEFLRAQLEELGEEAVDTAETIADIMAVGEYDKLEDQMEVPEDFREKVEAAEAELTGEEAEGEVRDLEVDEFADDASNEEEMQDEQMMEDDEEEWNGGQGEAGMAGLGKRMGAKQETQDEQMSEMGGMQDEQQPDDLIDREELAELRNYIEGCVLDSQMDLDQCYHAVQTEFGPKFTDAVIDDMYHKVTEEMMD